MNRYEFIKTSLNEKDPSVLSSFAEVEKALDNTTKSYKLEKGFLDPNETKKFELRLWLDEDTPAIDEVMNKTFLSKVTIATSFFLEAPTYSERVIACSESNTTAKCMLENSEYDTVNLAFDETEDNNLRYIGANPNNYVLFNGELWRVIGVMNNIKTNAEDEVGESRLKLIRAESIGNYVWDSSPSNINSGLGVNEWSQSKLMMLLNPGYEEESVGGSLYWNRQSGTCYSGESNGTRPCDFTDTGISDDVKKYISDAVWNLGTNGTADYNNILTNKFYEFERSTNVGKVCSGGKYCNDSVTRTITWTGYIGLIYPSDYGFATGGSTTNRETCLNTRIYVWNNMRDCYNNNWLYSNSSKFTMTSSAVSDASKEIFIVYDFGNIGRHGAGNTYAIYPTLYLNSNVKITNGDGTHDNPYKLS